MVGAEVAGEAHHLVDLGLVAPGVFGGLEGVRHRLHEALEDRRRIARQHLPQAGVGRAEGAAEEVDEAGIGHEVAQREQGRGARGGGSRLDLGLGPEAPEKRVEVHGVDHGAVTRLAERVVGRGVIPRRHLGTSRNRAGVDPRYRPVAGGPGARPGAVRTHRPLSVIFGPSRSSASVKVSEPCPMIRRPYVDLPSGTSERSKENVQSLPVPPS